MMDLKNYPGKERGQVIIISQTGLSKPRNQLSTMWPDVNPRFFHRFIWDVCDKAETDNGDQCEQAQIARLKNKGVLEAGALSPGRALSQKGSGEGAQPKTENGAQGP